MIRVNRDASDVTSYHVTLVFPLLDCVMVALAQGLPVLLIPEQVWVSLVWDDVIDDLGRCGPALLLAHDT